MEVWVDAGTNQLRRTQVTAEFPTVGEAEGYTSDLIIEVSRYNEAFNLTAT